MIRQELHDGWRLRATAGPVPAAVAGADVPAVVPGGTHLDLLAAGLIEHPYRDRVESDLVWMHRAEWRYRTEFTATAAHGERVDLAFDGLDTVATVSLNGVVVGSTANMHRSYRFDVTALVRDGVNELVVDFASALAHAERVEAELGWRDHVYPHPFNMVRKMACSFGWDWGPDLQTAGIWKPVRLERWHTARFASVRPLVTVDDDGTGRVAVHVDVERTDTDAEVRVTATVSGITATTTLAAGETSAVVELAVPDAPLWWPTGYGEQPLSNLEVTLDTGDSYRRRIGFRTITVDATPDEVGTPFTFVVNGKAVFAKGANWIPDDHFLTRITRERLARRVDQAVAANMNMLRVWGGGIYETEDFYDVCDERGVLVWQDFPFACSSYAEEQPLWGEIEAEARENVARLTSHPSLALWNGNNENLWGYADWGWPEQLQGKTWGLRYYTELLPAIVAELDPTRPYAIGSPHSPDGVHPNDEDHGPRHEWEVWNRDDYVHYRDHVPRFCAEFGFQGPPTWATLTAWVHDEPMTPTSPGFLLHQKAEDGNGKLDRGLAAHLPVPAAFADWHWATQLNQARAVHFGVAHFRSWWPRTAGALVWQLNDCWPVTSWSAVDGDERPKPLYYALRHAFAPRLLTVQPRGDALAVIAVNDTDEPWTGELSVRRMTLAGEVVAEAALPLEAGARGAARVDLPAVVLAGEDTDLLVVAAGEVRVVHLFVEDIAMPYDPNPVTASVAAVEGGYRVDVTASAFARDVALLADRVAADAVADDMLITLLPGETHSFHVSTAAEVDPAAFTAPEVLRSANALCAAAARSAG
ncbi:glycoside hydrolase family 2 protein [Actinokineospora sp. UTMC 2448]|uniref:glycoside hydrolase family 2 protein n=1 Tax=Actinokineospora sp. UTMC 2448 TaxID=2268449 RepID=UPI0021644768|nr:glycoside hydrolase family 2 protein [Actinokineospora sp. UTMC 2448]UVS78143.1 Exo-beta-D-glucosaminidase precursor [Actinokineospora sp. UTMC 2448]